MSAEVPAVGARYVKRHAPDQGRIVTVNRVWEAEDGHVAVAYEWRDDKSGLSFSACPLDVFQRTYRPETGMSICMSARERLFAVACDDMPVTSDEVNEAIDAYAHELAERQRAWAGQIGAFRSEEMRLRAEGLRMGADRIDPEVANG